MKMQEKMTKRLCKFINWYNETGGEDYYHFLTGYMQAMRDAGMQVEIIRNEFVICNGITYKAEDYK